MYDPTLFHASITQVHNHATVYEAARKKSKSEQRLREEKEEKLKLEKEQKLRLEKEQKLGLEKGVKQLSLEEQREEQTKE